MWKKANAARCGRMDATVATSGHPEYRVWGGVQPDSRPHTTWATPLMWACATPIAPARILRVSAWTQQPRRAEAEPSCHPTSGDDTIPASGGAWRCRVGAFVGVLFHTVTQCRSLQAPAGQKHRNRAFASEYEGFQVRKDGAGDGNRTHVLSLGSSHSTIELRPRQTDSPEAFDDSRCTAHVECKKTNGPRRVNRRSFPRRAGRNGSNRGEWRGCPAPAPRSP